MLIAVAVTVAAPDESALGADSAVPTKRDTVKEKKEYASQEQRESQKQRENYKEKQQVEGFLTGNPPQEKNEGEDVSVAEDLSPTSPRNGDIPLASTNEEDSVIWGILEEIFFFFIVGCCLFTAYRFVVWAIMHRITPGSATSDGTRKVGRKLLEKIEVFDKYRNMDHPAAGAAIQKLKGMFDPNNEQCFDYYYVEAIAELIDVDTSLNAEVRKLKGADRVSTARLSRGERHGLADVVGTILKIDPKTFRDGLDDAEEEEGKVGSGGEPVRRG